MRIVYGVSSEGMGHATRSSVAIEYLRKKGHDVHIFTSDRAYDYLSAKFPNVYNIQGIHIVYKDEYLDNISSIFQVLKTAHSGLLPTLRVLGIELDRIKPNVIISDFEFFTVLAAKALNIPVVAANNISILNRTKVDIKQLSLLYPRFFSNLSEVLATFSADYYVIPTFFFPKKNGKNVILVNPVVRKEITTQKPETGDHILVYQTSKTCIKLLKQLEKLPLKFYVYGFGKMKDKPNMKFFDFNEDGFIEHLRTSKAVILGGGFSLISESLYLKKPILSIPLKQHFEQITNAYYIQKMKFGEYHKDPNPQDIMDFTLKLDLYRHYLDKYDFDPLEMPKAIEKVIAKIGKTPDKKKLAALKHISRGQFTKLLFRK